MTNILSLQSLIVGLMLLCCVFVRPLAAFERSEDVAGSSDYQGLVRYPNAKIDKYSPAQQVEYQLALGVLKKVSGQLQPEYSNWVEGRLTRITYRIPDGHDERAAFNHFAGQLQAGELLFECHGRDCGSSNYWANSIFGIATLYGPEDNQHYRVTKLNSAGQELIVALYSIKRGNKRVYTHLDLLQPNSPVKLVSNPDTLLDKLRGNGYLRLTGISFDDQDRLLESSQQPLQQLAVALNKSTRLKLYVVGHLRGEQPLPQLMSRSLHRANSVVSALQQLGVGSERLDAQGVGPLAPVNKAGAVEGRGTEEGRIELVIRE